MTPSRGLCAALVASLALVAGCSSSATEPAAEEKPAPESTWVSAPTTAPADEVETHEDESDEDSVEDPTVGDSEPAQDGEPAKPRRAPHVVAVHFQNGLFNGDAEVCDLLSDEAREDLVRTKVAEGAVAEGSSCKKYVRTFGKSYEDWDVTVEAKVVTQTEEKAVVRVDMTLDDDVANTRMELVPAGDTWEITDWGQH